MSGFVVIAGLLTLAALVALLYPLLRRSEGSPESWRSAGVAGLLILVGAAALYPVWSNYKWYEPEPALDSPEAMVGRLARRLEKEPDNLEGWLMLGKSYGVIEQHDLAVRAYERANALAKGQNAEALMGLAEALMVSERSDLAGRAGQLFEQAMKLDPTSLKALFWSAFAARERNELPLARERFQQVLAANLPPEGVQIIEEQLQEIDTTLALTAGGAGQGPAAATQAVPAVSASGQATPVVAIPLRITLSSKVAGQAVAGAPLFVVARIPGQRQPVAAKRLEAKFPLDVELLSTDAMVGGSAFAAGQDLEVEARIANSGGAISRTGDPFGVITLKAGTGKRAAIEINQLRP